MKEALKDKAEYLYSDDTGDAQIIVYHLFPGVEVAYISVHMEHFDFALTEKNNCRRHVGIIYCREGRIEREINNEFFYLMPEDCAIEIQDKADKKFQFPLKHYHGISVRIDVDLAPRKFSAFMETEALKPENVAKRLCGEQQMVILRSVEQLKHIFAESYEIPEQHRVDYLKIKILELLFVLNHIDITKPHMEEYTVPRTQVELVKKAAEYISENLNKKLSLKTLTTMLGVSDTCLQQSFRAVYGMSVACFIRMQKMQKAAQELIHTDESIEEIAEKFGYINESKFSAAFKKLMGDSPSVYRREHSKIKIV